MELASAIAVVLIAVVITFQVALVLGAPWGAAAWVGQHPGVLPGRLRIASGASIAVLVFLGWIVLAAGGLVGVAPVPAAWLEYAIWVAAGYFLIGAAVNLVSRSPVERIWAPVSLAVAICCVIAAVTR